MKHDIKRLKELSDRADELVSEAPERRYKENAYDKDGHICGYYVHSQGTHKYRVFLICETKI